MSDRFCDSPWNHMNINSVGFIKPCCVFSKGKKPDSVNDNIFDWYNTAYEDVKEQGINHPGCIYCKKHEEVGITSRRERNHLRGKAQNGLTFIDLSFGNTCNLKCRMCESRNSTKWISDEKFLQQNDFDIQRDVYGINEMPPERVQQLVDYCNNSKQENFLLEIKGGEPFVTVAFLDFIESLSAEFKNKTTINIFSNGTGVSDYYIRKLKDFKKVDLRLSVEATGDMYNYIRGGDKHTLDDAIQFMGRLFKGVPNIKLGVSVTITMYNIFALKELKEKIDENLPGVSDQRVFSNICHKPDWLAPGILPSRIKEKLNVMYSDEPAFANFLKYINKTETNNDLMNKFIKFTKLLDEKRNENLLQIEPRFAEVFDAVE